MPTMIQTHLITCKDWATVRDTAKSLEHIIMKCDPPTLAMPALATGATVLGLYSHIAHSVDKEEGEIPQSFKGTKPKQTRGRGKPNGKPQEQKYNPPKAQEVAETYHDVNHNNIIITMPQVRTEAADHTWVRVEADNFEGLHHEIEAKNLNIVSINFKIITTREAHRNKIVCNSIMHGSPTYRETNRTIIEAEVGADHLNISEDAAGAGLITRIIWEHINNNITHMTSNQNNMVLPAVCVVDSIIPPSTAIRVNMT